MSDAAFLRRQGSTDSHGPCRADQSGIDGEKSGLSNGSVSGSWARLFLRRAGKLPRGLGKRCLGKDQGIFRAAFEVVANAMPTGADSHKPFLSLVRCMPT